jgi:hypothetical protein
MQHKMFIIDINPLEIFKWGIDFGQLMMEEERDGEDYADAFQGAIISNKYSMPSQIAPVRQPHSEMWRKAKRESLIKFMDLTVRQKNHQ